MKILLKTPTYNLADWIINTPDNPKLNNNLGVSFKNKQLSYKILHVTVYGTPYIAVYGNNGKTFFKEDDALEKYVFNDPVLWGIEDKAYFGYDGIIWKGEPDTEAVMKYFKLRSNNNDGYADFFTFEEE